MHGEAGVVGTLTLGGRPARGWSPAAVDLAVEVAALVARALEQQDVVQREALRALGELASGAAHHLNNLLTVVVGRVQLVLRSTDDERVQRTLAIVEKAAKDGADIVHQLQQFSRGRAVREPRPVRVDQLLAEVVATAQRSSPRTPLTKVDVDTRLGDVPAVAGDAAALREALRHILANAMDAMPTGGRLLIETRASDASVSIVISDTGVGMSPAVRLRAVEPFFTTKGLKVTGLGLSVAYGIVRSHGGDIAIRSAQGSGTTVIVTLPREGASSGAAS
jgi:signal transduction histidine kinase